MSMFRLPSYVFRLMSSVSLGSQMKDIPQVITIAATRFIAIAFTEDDEVIVGDETIRVRGEITAMIADRVKFGYVFGYG